LASTSRPIAWTSYISICHGNPLGWNSGTAASIASSNRRSRSSAAMSSTSSAKPTSCWKRRRRRPSLSAISRKRGGQGQGAVLARAIAEERDAERLAHARAELDDEERGRHARLLQEQDDLHRAVKRSRERVGVKNVGQFIRDNWLSNRCKTWSPVFFQCLTPSTPKWDVSWRSCR
jgi:hypothetical protein